MAKRSSSGRETGLGISAKPLEPALAGHPPGRFVLKLYVSGMTPCSFRAVENIQHLCVEHLAGRYDLEIIDIYQQPALARGEQILAVPTLVKKLPLPLRRVIGDMSDPGRILVMLGVVSPTEDKK